MTKKPPVVCRESDRPRQGQAHTHTHTRTHTHIEREREERTFGARLTADDKARGGGKQNFALVRKERVCVDVAAFRPTAGRAEQSRQAGSQTGRQTDRHADRQAADAQSVRRGQRANHCGGGHSVSVPPQSHLR